jgi:enolase
VAKISDIKSREIIDSRGNPTVEVDIVLDDGSIGRAAVPSGASTGAHEAHELRDGDKKRYLGKGVKQAVANALAAKAVLVGKDVSDQRGLDQALLDWDGSTNKSKYGANALLGLSLAAAKANAISQKKSLFSSLSGATAVRLPVPLMNVLNGGAHANNGLDVQEFMIAPVLGGSFSEALRAGCEIFHTLKKIIDAKGFSTAVGDEGGFAPRITSNKEALVLLMEAIEKAGYKPGDEIKLALDVASTELFAEGQYRWEGRQISSSELADIYMSWSKEFPIISIEDGFAEDDWEGWINMTAKTGGRLQLVGDDLFVTNPKRLAEGIERKAANALLVKVNQIGTLSETREAVSMAQKASYKTVMSHRSGETEDSTIADLAVALNCEQIKTGSLCRGERTAKYNQLLRIEEELGNRAEFWGAKAFN